MQDFKSEMSDIDNFAPFVSVPSILHYIKYLRKSIEAEAEKADLKAEIQRLKGK